MRPEDALCLPPHDARLRAIARQEHRSHLVLSKYEACRLDVVELYCGAGDEIGGEFMAKQPKSLKSKGIVRKFDEEELRLSSADFRQMMYLCVDFLDLCIRVSGRIDPAAAWLVAHARDEVTLGVFEYRE